MPKSVVKDFGDSSDNSNTHPNTHWPELNVHKVKNTAVQCGERCSVGHLTNERACHSTNPSAATYTENPSKWWSWRSGKPDPLDPICNNRHHNLGWCIPSQDMWHLPLHIHTHTWSEGQRANLRRIFTIILWMTGNFVDYFSASIR